MYFYLDFCFFYILYDLFNKKYFYCLNILFCRVIGWNFCDLKGLKIIFIIVLMLCVYRIGFKLWFLEKEGGN